MDIRKKGMRRITRTHPYTLETNSGIQAVCVRSEHGLSDFGGMGDRERKGDF